MKAILSVALVLGLCGLAGAADERQTTRSGRGSASTRSAEQKRTSTLTIKKDGDKLAGTMSWPDQKDDEAQGPETQGREADLLRRAEVHG